MSWDLLRYIDINHNISVQLTLWSRLSVKMTTDQHIMLRLKTIPSHLHTPSLCSICLIKHSHTFYLSPFDPWKLILILKNSVPTSQKTYCISITKTKQLMLFREISTVYSENHTKYINTLFGQNAKCFNIKAASPYICHYALKGYQCLLLSNLSEFNASWNTVHIHMLRKVMLFTHQLCKKKNIQNFLNTRLQTSEIWCYLDRH